ncbi:TIGR01244 family protein [Jannaschia faecimaris]|uniref:TIGR01244 family protein n=1 Tax=Jannaschia faecimaris TaxID=1244108 RepID=A0A1H3RQV1_9RHOB|nr:TIGR01244 family sulfur transferase [Jannaschia faecimaris]SDZ27269.1 TIGR01244 family protein [Jannaschia faecimaris]
MDLRPLDDTTFVAPQLEPADMAALAADGVTTVICNRPDVEVPATHQAAAMQAAVEAAGMNFVFNPVSMPQLTEQAVEEQSEAIDNADGKIVAYCASGTRSAILWALAQAGQMPVDDILTATANAGYPLDGLRQQIIHLEGQK